MSVVTEFEKLYDPHSGGWYLPPHLTELFDPSCVDEWRTTKPLNYGPVEREVGQFYASLVRLLRPKRILETGTHMGYSTSCIASALSEVRKDGHILTIDIYAQEHLFKAYDPGCKITFFLGDSLELDIKPLNGLFKLRNKDDLPVFDMLFLDADHRYKAIVGEINRFAPLLAVGGTMVLHDSMYYDGIGLAVQQVQQTGLFNVVNLRTPRQHDDNTRPPGITLITKLKPFIGDCLTLDPKLIEIEGCLPGRTIYDPALVG